MSPKETGADQELPPPLPLGMPVGGQDDSHSTIVAPIVTSSSNEPEPPTPPSPGATRSATPTASPDLQPSMAFTPVRAPDRYEILAEHGRGGIGCVSRAHDRELGRDVAIKELISRNSLAEARFLREATITARLEHPGVVPVHDAGRWPDGTPFYAMKLVAGRPLRDLIAERTTVEQRIGLLHHVIAVADAIAYAHGRNIIHRDLKPANVIVGDFGETVVIDWGLAKDLSNAEESTIAAAPFRASLDAELTSTGAVLGTPTYMPPEQERGEPVDQRADVFAIGAMLWELCSLQKVPPANIRQRHRMLRRAGIDHDLAVIIDKTLDRDPERRYPDAGALAADLKAFKSGARIGARSYSVPALLAHWTRRHRAMTLSAAAAAALAFTGIVVYIENISIERDRADVALARTEAAKNNLTLEHAELLLRSDPTAAMATLSQYRGTDDLRRGRLLAEATGLGVAKKILELHGDTIWFLRGDTTGTILSFGEDGRIRSTRESTSISVATDASLDVRLAYAPSVKLLAYSTSPAGIAVLQLSNHTSTRIGDGPCITLRFSADGSRLAALNAQGELVVWSIAQSSISEIHRASLPGGSGLVFMSPDRILVRDGSTIHVVSLDVSKSTTSSVNISKLVSIDARPDLIATGSSDGRIELRNASFDVMNTASPCRARVNSVQLVLGTKQLVFACNDGVAGIMRFDSELSALEVGDVIQTRGSTYAATDPSGEYVTLLDESRTAYIHDIETRITHSYAGHAGQPTYVAAPTPEFPYVLTGDSNGTVRLWDSPSRGTRVILQAPVPLYGLALGRDGKILLANGSERIVRGIRLEDHSMFDLPGDASGTISTRIAPDGSSMLAHSYDGTARVWRTSDHALTRTFREHKGLIGDVDYVTSDRIVSVGDDGKLLQWTPSGSDVTELFRSDAALERLEVLSPNGAIIANDQSGNIWEISSERQARHIRKADGTTITILRASRDGRFVAIGSDAGLVVVYETQDWKILHTTQMRGSIRQLVFEPRSHDLLIASEASRGQLGHVRILPLDSNRIYRWYDVPAAVRDVTYASDGSTLGIVCADGGLWLYSRSQDAWAYANDKHTDTLVGAFSADGRSFWSVDRHGAVIVRDVASVFDSR
jgi:eukaryotic-like serine/threonine-protein kinase